MEQLDPEPRPISAAERDLLLKLLSADFFGRDELCRQLEGLKVKSIDKERSLRFFVSNEVKAPIKRAVVSEARSRDSDTVAEIGPYINLLLHVEDGTLKFLESFKDDGSPILCPPKPSELKLIV